jgi:hypothetical protein
MVTTTMALPEDLHHKLALVALEQRTVMTELVRQAVREWLVRHKHIDAPRKRKP